MYCASGCSVKDSRSNSGSCDWEARMAVAKPGILADDPAPQRPVREQQSQRPMRHQQQQQQRPRFRFEKGRNGGQQGRQEQPRPEQAAAPAEAQPAQPGLPLEPPKAEAPVAVAAAPAEVVERQPAPESSSGGE
jgi:hypothetical protein